MAPCYKLDWKGPFQFFSGQFEGTVKDSKTLFNLTQPGVYLLFYQGPAFGNKTGAYIGKADCLIHRFFEHVGWYLSGGYSVIDTKAFKYFFLGDLSKEELKMNLPKAWNEVKSLDYFFANPYPILEEGHPDLYGLEFALIRKFQNFMEREESQKTHFFLQDGRGCRRGKNSFTIKLSGPDKIISLFGKKFYWDPEKD